jgi:hypothetical protein
MNRHFNDSYYHDNYSHLERLEDHYSEEDFLERLSFANEAPKLTARDLDFLASIEAKFDEYGEQMFFSEAQYKYLQGLAIRGGWRPAKQQGTEE